MQKANHRKSSIMPVLGALLVLMPGTLAFGQQGLSGFEIAKLVGTTTSQRANMICTLAPRARDGLTAQETAVALGDLSGVYRLKALTCLAPHVQTNLTGSEAAQIVGAGQSFRADMACQIADHFRPNLSSKEADTILDELSGVYRLKALRCLEPRLGHNLTGIELAQVVGDKLSFRRDMLCAISSHAKGDMASDQLASALGGLTGVYRLQAIKCLEPSAARPLTGEDLARVVGPGQSFRKDMLCALAGHTSGAMPADELSMALGDLAGVYRLQAIQCLDRNALAVTDRLSLGENTLRFDPEPRDAGSQPETGSNASGAAFARGQVWRGRYLCAQGPTNLELDILGVSSDAASSGGGEVDKVSAIFSFNFNDGAAEGAFYLGGTYNLDERSATLSAQQWIKRPPGYFGVGMTGQVSADGRSYSGTIAGPGCGAFSVQLTEERLSADPPPGDSRLGVCGSEKWQLLLVPDYLRFDTGFGGVVDVWRAVYLGEACRAHDSCYGRAGSQKSACDSEFLQVLTTRCNIDLSGGLWTLARAKCQASAAGYFGTVSRLGCDAFKSAQRTAGVVEASCD